MRGGSAGHKKPLKMGQVVALPGSGALYGANDRFVAKVCHAVQVRLSFDYVGLNQDESIHTFLVWHHCTTYIEPFLYSIRHNEKTSRKNSKINSMKRLEALAKSKNLLDKNLNEAFMDDPDLTRSIFWAKSSPSNDSSGKGKRLRDYR